MNFDLKDKVALVTGSSKGIGKIIAKTLYDEGCTVILNGRDRHSLKTTSKLLGNSTFFEGDVTDLKICNNLIKFVLKTHKKLDILVCNVGSGNSIEPGKEDPTEIQRMLSLNLFSAINTIHASLDLLKKSKGTVVCISSIAGKETFGAPIGYSLAKSALNNYVIGTSKSLAKYGIRINTVSPGNIIFKGSVWENFLKENPSKVKKTLNDVALKRLGTPEEVANMVAFLISPCSSFTTGTNIIIDGGQTRS
jgi:3-oxoacyl-[acyl-carrier protein] reductase